MLKLLFAQPADRPLRILCIGAHCDDIEIGAGATIMRLLAEHPGSEVCWLVCASTPPRRVEAEASLRGFCAAAGSLATTIGDLPENVLPQHVIEIRELLDRHARPFQPDIVFCPHRGDLHQDHRLLAEMALQLFRDHPILEYEIAKYDGDLQTPNLYVAVDDSLAARKVGLLFEHFPTQHSRTWFDREAFFGLMRLRGIECNERYAEGFHVQKAVI
ncbi:MAG TPA: PIG-L deacetylase family protein [Acidimicrobiales bacterium]|nr:PIG-L deacetylase family protein [Acidimicrobiales bacterium]